MAAKPFFKHARAPIAGVGAFILMTSLAACSLEAPNVDAHATRAATAPTAHLPVSSPAVESRSSEQPPVGSGGKVLVRSAKEASTALGSAVGAAPTPGGGGFWVAWSSGEVTTEGNAHFYGDLVGIRLSKPIVAIAATPNGEGYWLLGADGGVFEFGDAAYYGSTGNIHLNAPALQVDGSPNGHGYDFVASDGGVFTFGDAHFYGSTGNIRLNKPVVGMASDPNGSGYWLVASDGGIFEFGGAHFYGSTGNVRLNASIVAVAPTANGGGYWLLGADGGIFEFGNAAFHGSGVGQTGGSPAVGLVATNGGGGYWIILADGRILSFGDAPAMSGPQADGPPAPNSSYVFEVANAAGRPARWNPCDGVDFAVVDAGAPAGWQNDINTAIGQVSQATGLSFNDVGVYGAASEVPATAKLTINWSPTITGGDDIGLTTYWYILDSAYTPQIVKAQIQLLTSLHAGDGPGGEEPVLLHELGHAMGLAHTPNADEVMNPVDIGLPAYQAGDLNGLWQVGAAQGCAGFYP
jgi:hypothetical protein